jgi:hypothetical protein
MPDMLSGPEEVPIPDATAQLTALTRLCHEFADAESTERIFDAAADALVAGAGVKRAAVLALTTTATCALAPSVACRSSRTRTSRVRGSST